MKELYLPATKRTIPYRSIRVVNKQGIDYIKIELLFNIMEQIDDYINYYMILNDGGRQIKVYFCEWSKNFIIGLLQEDY